MKLFIISLCALGAIAAFCIFGSIKSIDVIDDILEELHEVPGDTGSVPEGAKEMSRNILEKWEEDLFIISIFHPHVHLDQVKEKMVSLDSYSNTDEYAEWKQAHASLEEALMHLRELLKANADNIM